MHSTKKRSRTVAQPSTRFTRSKLISESQNGDETIINAPGRGGNAPEGPNTTPHEVNTTPVGGTLHQMGEHYTRWREHYTIWGEQSIR